MEIEKDLINMVVVGVVQLSQFRIISRASHACVHVDSRQRLMVIEWTAADVKGATNVSS